MPRFLDHAVVLGGSAAGLLAARVLADHAERVTLVERDPLPAAPGHRKGTPQSLHASNLTARALWTMERWFPRLGDELAAAGATMPDARQMTLVLDGRRLARPAPEHRTPLVTRPVLDAALRRQVIAAGVTILDGRRVTGLLAGDGRIAGAHVVDDHGHTSLRGDLVVDAMGRGSRGPTWLAELGHEAPAEEVSKIRVRYASRTFPRRPDDAGGDLLIVVAAHAGSPRGGVAMAVEGDRWLVTLYAYGGEAPPVDLEGFRRFAASLDIPDLGALLADRPPLDAGHAIGFPAATVRRFDRVRRPPPGYVAFGDVFVSLNPCYGRGVTAATLQAEALDAVLRRGDALPRAFYRRAHAALRDCVALQTGLDAQIPGALVDDPTPRPLRAYLARARAVAARDPIVAAALLRIAALEAPRPSILRPSIAWRVLRAPRDRGDLTLSG